MSEKKFILSSAGLKNVIEEEKYFTFIFGEKKIRMNSIFAEFLSPVVSRLHRSDPTIDSINFAYPHHSHNFFSSIEELFSEEMIKLVQNISKGQEIALNKEQANKMQQISIILCNNELYKSLQTLFHQTENETEIEEDFTKLELFQYETNIPGIIEHIDKNDLIDSISRKFYSIDQSKLKKLSKSILFDIISNKNLKIESEDSLFDIINDIFESEESENKESELTIVDFYQLIFFNGMSENKFKEFVKRIKGNEMTIPLWSSISNRFLNKCKVKERYVYNEEKENESEDLKCKIYQYKSDSFDGIIRHLKQENGKSANDKINISVTSSGGYGGPPECIIDFDNLNTKHITNNNQNGWIKYDFKEHKVKPTHYSIRTWNSCVNSFHLKSWVIEGSNDGANEWKVLDSKNNVTCLSSASAYHTFEIKENQTNNEFYQFLRLRITDVNTAGNYQICISSLEFFGSLILNEK